MISSEIADTILRSELDKVLESFEKFAKERVNVVKSYHGGEPMFFPLDVKKISGQIKFF